MATPRSVLWESQPHECHYCPRFLTFWDVTADHIVPRSRGGDSSLHNLVIACQPCNHAKGDAWPTCDCDRCTHAVARLHLPGPTAPSAAAPASPAERWRSKLESKWPVQRNPPLRGLYESVDPTLHNAVLSQLAARP